MESILSNQSSLDAPGAAVSNAGWPRLLFILSAHTFFTI
ncbi:unnamed protein product [Tetraodon nigroviridis]|uniref:(spotted green pufferfish) hypothetical protein n=1 Tax=Tetraodon nigroviridis TaxID=99883 RepID=Q4RQA4_TETNG|nr:unnamed protein product [Tetraodon nigroviridis]